jgi:hypothetical protein
MRVVLIRVPGWAADDLLVFEDQLMAVAALGRHSPEHSLDILTSLLRDAVTKLGGVGSTEEVWPCALGWA